MRPTVTYFDLFNALVTEWLDRLSWSELRVLLVFLYHADHEGIAYPTAPSIADKTGMKARHVKSAIASLKDRGLLVTVKRGGGRDANGKGIATLYRLNIPTVTTGVTVNGDNIEQPTVPSVGRNGDSFRRPTVTTDVTPTSHTTTHEHPTQQHSGEAAARGVVVDDGLVGDFARMKIGKAEATRHISNLGEAFCRRLVELVDHKRRDNPKTIPARLMRHFLNEPSAVDFSELEINDALEDEVIAGRANAGLYHVLVTAGIHDGKATAITAARPVGLTPLVVMALWLDATKRDGIKDVAAYIAARIKLQDFSSEQRLTVENVCKWINAGFISRVAGYPVEPGVKWNSLGLYLNGDTSAPTIRADEIGLQGIEIGDMAMSRGKHQSQADRGCGPTLERFSRCARRDKSEHPSRACESPDYRASEIKRAVDI